MPVLLRIIVQRLLVLLLSGLAFVGITPELHIPTHEEAEIATEKRKEAIQEALQEKGDTEDDIQHEYSAIPLPQKNILDIQRTIPKTPNITKPGTNRTTPPVIDPAPAQTQIEPIPEKVITVPTTPSAPPVVTPPQESKPPIVSTTSAINDVVVNILCMRHNGNRIHVSSGSGVFISAKGVILTNAHVAQMFLLKDIGYECTIRRENIPAYGFTAIPLYISEKWITNNYRAISNPSPTGTGEDDYALLLITGTTESTVALPQSFGYARLNPNADAASINDKVIVAGYPGIQTADISLAVQAPLKTDTVAIKNVFTLDRITVDVFSTSDTHVAQRGASGGGVFEDGKLIGIIVTTNQGSSPGSNIINALTLDYINRDIQEETGKTLIEYSSGNLLEKARLFDASVGSRLTELLLQIL